MVGDDLDESENKMPSGNVTAWKKTWKTSCIWRFLAEEIMNGRCYIAMLDYQRVSRRRWGPTCWRDFKSWKNVWRYWQCTKGVVCTKDLMDLSSKETSDIHSQSWLKERSRFQYILKTKIQCTMTSSCFIHSSVFPEIHNKLWPMPVCQCQQKMDQPLQFLGGQTVKPSLSTHVPSL